MRRSLAFAALLLTTTAPALAQNSAPMPLPIEDTIPAAQDVDYPGRIQLHVDATNVEQGIFRAHETIPVAQAGPMTLLYPAWLPGKHAERGELEKLTGLVIRAGRNGPILPWTRDSLDVYAFHIDVPAGVDALNLSFEFTSAVSRDQGRIVVAPNMMNLQFPSVSLYPAGYFTRRIPIEAVVDYPEGWTARSGLPASNRGATYTYQKTNYQTLVDSPVFAGRYFREWPLTDRVDLNVFADTPDELDAKPEMIDAHRRLVEQAVKLFGTQQYDHYEFLLALSDEMGGIGLEHHRSSENGPGLGYFKDWDNSLGARNLLPHEFTHSWNGKYRRGADLWTPDYRMPMRDTLLWVYEGQTQFWGYVLGARSGMLSKQDTLDALANIGASLDATSGRTWRPMIDTTHDPIIAARAPKPWRSWQRSEDYYNEGLLIWLEADSKIRELTNGAKSMDDFAHAFFGSGRDGDYGEVTYTFDDIVATLNGVVPWDWASFLRERVYQTNEHAPLDGFTNNGYRLIYTDEPTNWIKNRESGGSVDLTYSIGAYVGSSGNLSSVTWGSPAFDAGLDVADTILAVNGTTYSGAGLKDAITAAKEGRDPIRLTIQSGDRIHDVTIDYHDGLRYPRLEKTGDGETGLDRLLAPR